MLSRLLASPDGDRPPAWLIRPVEPVAASYRLPVAGAAGETP